MTADLPGRARVDWEEPTFGLRRAKGKFDKLRRKKRRMPAARGCSASRGRSAGQDRYRKQVDSNAGACNAAGMVRVSRSLSAGPVEDVHRWSCQAWDS